MEMLEVLGKILFALLMVDSGIAHFKYKDQNVSYARFHKMPLPEFNVVVSGIILILAPIFYIFGIFELASLISIALFLFLASFILHRYWADKDMETRRQNRMAFYKNLSMLGLILVIISGM